MPEETGTSTLASRERPRTVSRVGNVNRGDVETIHIHFVFMSRATLTLTQRFRLTGSLVRNYFHRKEANNQRNVAVFDWNVEEQSPYRNTGAVPICRTLGVVGQQMFPSCYCEHRLEKNQDDSTRDNSLKPTPEAKTNRPLRQQIKWSQYVTRTSCARLTKTWIPSCVWSMKSSVRVLTRTRRLMKARLPPMPVYRRHDERVSAVRTGAVSAAAWISCKTGLLESRVAFIARNMSGLRRAMHSRHAAQRLPQ